MDTRENFIESDELYEHHRVIVDKGQAPVRIDKFLTARLQNVSRNKIQQAASCNCILVNEVPVKSNYKIKPGDTISVVLPEPPRDKEIKPENIPVSIVYEDDSLLIVNKPAGMVVHPAYGNYEGTLVNALLYYFNNLPGGAEVENRAGLVHRIDKDTSGLLVIAKSEYAQSFLARQFYNHTISRSYVALVWGNIRQETGTIKTNLTRDPKDRKKIKAVVDENIGKPAVTHYKVMEKFACHTLIECTLETGRTHQIRVHMKYIGHPIFNDETYGGSEILAGPSFTKYKQFIANCFKIMPRQALHARSLGFIHPATRKKMFFESELPEDFNLLLEKLRKN